MAQAPGPGQPGYPGNAPPDPRGGGEGGGGGGGGPYTYPIINGWQYTLDRNGEQVGNPVRIYPEAGGGGGGGGGADPASLAYQYARLDQEQRQWEAEMAAAQAQGGAAR